MQADRIYCGDALTVLKTLPDNSVNCCVTSPPYYALRDYGVDGQIGREETPALYVERLTSIFREVRRVLTPDGTLWLNIADTYAGKGNQGEALDPKYPNGRTGQVVALNGKVEGCKAKDMIGIPWLLAFALRSDGWYLRSDIIWHERRTPCRRAPRTGQAAAMSISSCCPSPDATITMLPPSRSRLRPPLLRG